MRRALATALLVVVGCSGDAADQTTTTEPGEITTTALSTTSTSSTPTTTAPTTTTTTLPPTTTTTLPQVWDPVTVEGSGDNFVEFSTPGDDAAALEITHDGSSNFIVGSYTLSNERIDGLVNDIGSYEGTVPINFFTGEEVGFIEVQADGNWTMTATPLLGLEVLPGMASGSGDDVVVVSISSPAVQITHNGESNFIVRAYTSEGTDGLVNEIGAYDGTVRAPTGTVVFEVNADGDWSLATQ